jgi:defect in organelle trafficking protein DotC
MTKIFPSLRAQGSNPGKNHGLPRPAKSAGLAMTTLILTLCLPLIGCGSRSQDTATLSDLQKIRVNPEAIKGKKGKHLSSIRLQALQDTAMGISARSGLAMQAQAINQQLEKQDRELRQVFNFNALLLEHNVLPPVLAEGRDSLNLADDDTIRLADRTYQIVSQARFVTTPPQWREYLWMDYQKPELPNAVLLPKSAEEKRVWDKYVETGWQQGIKQAEQIFADNLARMKRDYAGMVLYRKLLAQRIVSAPFVAKAELGVTGGGSDMRVNDQILRITAHPSLQSNSKAWKAVPVPKTWGPPNSSAETEQNQDD